MDESPNNFPMDFYVEDPSPRPWKFRPKGYLVAILPDAEEAQAAQVSLVASAFASTDVKVYTGEDIIKNREVYEQRRTVTDAVAGQIIDDVEAKELYLDLASHGYSALWLRVRDDEQVAKALRVLADHRYVRARHYGKDRQTDFSVG
jgi:hypothetical protein